MGNIEAQSAAVLPPINIGIFVASATTTTAYLDLYEDVKDPLTGQSLPRYLMGRFVSLQADGGDVYIALMSNDSDPIDPTSATGAFEATDACIKIPQDQRYDFWIPVSDHHYLAYVTATGTARLRLWASSSPAVR